MSLYLGCPIWAHKGWVGNFFPKGTKSADFLREYARRLTAVEGNTTFYAVPSPETIKRWKDETPEGFRFCPRIPRTVSHAGRLMPHLDDARRFVETMRGLGARLGPLFMQLPPRYSPALTDDLRGFFDRVAARHEVGRRSTPPRLVQAAAPRLAQRALARTRRGPRVD